MRISLIILFTTILSSCSNSPSSEINTTDLPENIIEGNVEDLIIVEENEDCIFDLATQNADFLKSIKEFKDIIWIDSLHTGFLKQQNGDTIEINRGGCTHYSYYISIHSYSDTNSVQNIDYWSNEILAIANLLPDFENKMIDSLLTNKQYDIESTDTQLYLVLNQDIYCAMTFVITRTEDRKMLIELGYYLC